MPLPPLPSLGSRSLPALSALSRSNGRVGNQTVPYEEQESMIRKVMGAGLSGLAAVGNLFDLPGSAVRDLLAGENPIDQLLTPFSPDNRTTGRELLRKGGAIGSQDTYGNFWGGLGLEILLDPLLPLTASTKALTNTGKVASKAGVLDSGLRKVIGMTPGIGPIVPGTAAGSTARQAIKKIAKGEGAELGRFGPRTARMNTKIGELAAQSPLTRKALEKAAGGPQELAALIAKDEPLGALGRYGFGDFSFNFGKASSPLAQTVAQGMDVIGHTVRYSAPIRYAATHFNKSTNEFVEEAGQKAGAIYEDARKLSEAAAREQAAPIARKIHEALGSTVSAADGASMYRYLEGVNPNLPQNLAHLQPELDKLKTLFSDQRAEEVAAGLKSHQLNDVMINSMGQQQKLDYAARVRAFFKDDVSKRSPHAKEQQILDTSNPHQITRSLRDMEEGTGFLLELSIDKGFSGAAFRTKDFGNLDDFTDAAFNNQHLGVGQSGGLPQYATKNDVLYEAFTRKYGADLPGAQLAKQDADFYTREAAGLTAPGELPPSVSKGWNDANASDFAVGYSAANRDVFRFVKYLDPRHVEHNLPAFFTNPAEGLVRRLEHGKRSVAAAGVIRQLVAQNARVADQTGAAPSGMTKVSDLVRASGLTGDNWADAMMGDLSQKSIDDALDIYRTTSGNQNLQVSDLLPQDFANVLFVPDNIAADTKRFMESFTNPKYYDDVKGLFNQATNLFKGFVTSVWPAFHARNFLSGQYQNLQGGAYGTFGQHSAWALGSTKRAFTGKSIKGAQDILNDPAFIGDMRATEKLGELAYAYGVVVGYTSDIAEHGAQAGASMAQKIPGLVPQKGAIDNLLHPGQGLEKLGWKKRLNPFRTRGAASDNDEFILAAIGADIGTRTENFNRFGAWLGFLKQGVDPGEAARRVKALQVDYSNLTQFEKKYMKTAFPFYSFTRNIIPYHIQQLIQEPGGKLAQTIRGINRARNPGDITPDYVAESAAVPLGEGVDGSDQYLTGFGLMLEDPLSFLGGGVAGAGLEAASRLNPAVKAPLEWITKQTFFQKGPAGGRPLDDLDPTVGRTLSNIGHAMAGTDGAHSDPVNLPKSVEFILANSPASRLLTTARKISDPRKSLANKAINTLTGFSIANVSEANKDAILREKASEIMRDEGAMKFTRTSFSEEQILQLPLADQARARQFQALMSTLNKRAKERKKLRDLAE